MNKHVRVALLVSGVALTTSVGTWFAAAKAFGIPDSNATPALVYSGVLLKDGLPITREVEVEVSLWNDPITPDTSALLCTTGEGIQLTPDGNGAFSIPLPANADNPQADCLGAIASGEPVYVQVELDGDDVLFNVNGTDVKRLALAAVPYAAEARNAEFAKRAAGDDQDLAQRFQDIEARLQALETP